MSTKTKKHIGISVSIIAFIIATIIIGLVVGIESGIIPGVSIIGYSQKATIVNKISTSRITIQYEDGTVKETKLAGVASINMDNNDQFIKDYANVGDEVWVEEIYTVNANKSAVVMWWCQPPILVTNQDFIYGTLNGTCLLFKNYYKVDTKYCTAYRSFFNNLKLRNPNLSNEDNWLVNFLNPKETKDIEYVESTK